jgi:hypothetical protein
VRAVRPTAEEPREGPKAETPVWLRFIESPSN